MRRILLGLLVLSHAAFSNDIPVTLEHVDVNLHDRASIMRGAKMFAGTCMACHTAKYLAHDQLAHDAGVTLDKMPLHQKEWLYGVTPPDLSLIARVRGADWLYTYFHSFYQDASRPTGSNNLLVPNSVMTNIFSSLQGIQQKISDNKATDALLHYPPHYYDVLVLSQSGSQTPEAFDETTRDLVNFLVYASDPHAIERKKMGIYVLIFLGIFFVVVYALKNEIWRDQA